MATIGEHWTSLGRLMSWTTLCDRGTHCARRSLVDLLTLRTRQHMRREHAHAHMRPVVTRLRERRRSALVVNAIAHTWHIYIPIPNYMQSRIAPIYSCRPSLPYNIKLCQKNISYTRIHLVELIKRARARAFSHLVFFITISAQRVWIARAREEPSRNKTGNLLSFVHIIIIICYYHQWIAALWI